LARETRRRCFWKYIFVKTMAELISTRADKDAMRTPPTHEALRRRWTLEARRLWAGMVTEVNVPGSDDQCECKAWHGRWGRERECCATQYDRHSFLVQRIGSVLLLMVALTGDGLSPIAVLPASHYRPARCIITPILYRIQHTASRLWMSLRVDDVCSISAGRA
jgi:hypothetical protein